MYVYIRQLRCDLELWYLQAAALHTSTWIARRHFVKGQVDWVCIHRDELLSGSDI